MRRGRLVQASLIHAAFVAAMCAIVAFTVFITGCGDEEIENPVGMEEGAAETVGSLKMPDTAPGAPMLQKQEGVPTVTSVGYYSDWKLTKPLTGTVSKGKTIYIKVEFSENMKLVVADDKQSRPILYRRVGGKLIRFNIADFGAKGEDFSSGDAKPRGKTTTSFSCKYTVQPEDTGEFTLAIGKLSVDLQDNALPAFYTHREKLRLGKPSVPTVESVGFYSDGRLTKPLTDTVPSGTLIYTKIVFSEEMEQVVSDSINARPELYYRIGNRDIRHNIVPPDATGRHYAPGDTKPGKAPATYIGKYRLQPDDRGRFTLVVGRESANKNGVKLVAQYVHTETLRILEPPPEIITRDTAPPGARDLAGFVYIPQQPVSTKHFYRSRVYPVPGATVTALSGPASGKRVITDQDGRYIFRNVGGEELHLRVEKEGFEPKEVLVHRSRPTTLANGVKMNFPKDVQNTPGNILVGHRWPDRVRGMLDTVTVVHDLLYVDARELSTPIRFGGWYGDGIVWTLWALKDFNELTFRVILVHEITHAHQHAVVSIDGSGNVFDWEETAEGKAFIEATRKDRAEVGEHPILDQDPYYRNDMSENAAEFYALYWLSITRELTREQAPNRFKWADTWLPKERYTKQPAVLRVVFLLR